VLSNHIAKSGLYDFMRIGARSRQPMDRACQGKVAADEGHVVGLMQTIEVQTVQKWPLACIFFGEISKAAMTVPNCERATTAEVVPNRRNRLSRAWGRVRWKITAIIAFTGASVILIACLALAALNVVVRRESANVVEKQIQMFVQASRSVAHAILDHAGACMGSPMNLKPLLA
jgi:hypothetical protein